MIVLLHVGIFQVSTLYVNSTLLPDLDVPIRTVFTECKPRQRLQEFLIIPRTTDRDLAKALDLYLIIGNYSTHESSELAAF